MERGEGPGVWVSAEGAQHVLAQAWDVFISVFRYIPQFISDVAGESWIGAAVVFSIFFAVFLIRAGARSGLSNIAAFAGALEHYASWGLAVISGYGLLLGLVWAVMPVWTILLASLVNGATGGEPGPLQLVAFLAEGSAPSKAFLRDVRDFYASGKTVLPIGMKGAFMIGVAFGTMWLVARGMGRIRA